MAYGSPPTGGRGVQFESVTVEDKPETGGGGCHSYNGSTEPLVTDSNSSEDSAPDLPQFERNSDGEDGLKGLTRAMKVREI